MGHDGLLKVMAESGDREWFIESKSEAADMEIVARTIYSFLIEMARLYNDGPPIRDYHIFSNDGVRRLDRVISSNPPPALTKDSAPETTEEHVLSTAEKYAKENGLLTEKTNERRSGISLLIDPRNKMVLYHEYPLGFLARELDSAMGKLIRYGYRFQPSDGYARRPDITSSAELAKRIG